MIIRRRLTRHFTTIDNAILEDPRLSAEAMGVLLYLISRPDDWQVRLVQLGKRFRVGRDKIQGVMREIIACGYAKHERKRDSNTGAFASGEYVLTDEPANIGNGGSSPQPENPIAVALPRPDYPAPAIPVMAYKKDTTKTDRQQIERRAHGSDVKGGQATLGSMLRASTIDPSNDQSFVAFMEQWPTGSTDNWQSAFAVWIKLSDVEQKLARQGIDPYLKALSGNKRTMHCAAATYLANQPWKHLMERPAEGAKSGTVMVGAFTTTWWSVFHDKQRRGESLRQMVAQATEGLGYSVKAASLPTRDADQQLVQFSTESQEYRTYSNRLAQAGIRLPDNPMPFAWLPEYVTTIAKAS